MLWRLASFFLFYCNPHNSFIGFVSNDVIQMLIRHIRPITRFLFIHMVYGLWDLFLEAGFDSLLIHHLQPRGIA